MHTTFSIRIALLGLALGGGIPAAITRAQDKLQYNRDIRPILVENCFACHGADSAARKADLRLDKRDAAIEYGAISPGKPDGSSLVERILSDDADVMMPPPDTK